MALYPQTFIDDLKHHADIVVVIQDYVSLKKTGATYKGLCPFHGEKTPSFHVNRDKGFFHCFGCGVGGDVVQVPRAPRKSRLPGRREAVGPALRHDASGNGAERRPEGERGRTRDTAQGPRVRRPVVPRTADVAGRYPDPTSDRRTGASPTRRPRPWASASRHPSRTALKAALLAQGFSEPVLLSSRTARPARRGRKRRSLQESPDDSDPPGHRVGHRFWRPRG